MGWMHGCLRPLFQDQVFSALRGSLRHVPILWRHFLARVAVLIQFHIVILNHHLSETLEGHPPSDSAHYSCDGNTRRWHHHLDPFKMYVDAPYSGGITLIWSELRSFCRYEVQATGLTLHIVWHHEMHSLKRNTIDIRVLPHREPTYSITIAVTCTDSSSNGQTPDATSASCVR